MRLPFPMRSPRKRLGSPATRLACFTPPSARANSRLCFEGRSARGTDPGSRRSLAANKSLSLITCRSSFLVPRYPSRPAFAALSHLESGNYIDSRPRYFRIEKHRCVGYLTELLTLPVPSVRAAKASSSRPAITSAATPAFLVHPMSIARSRSQVHG